MTKERNDKLESLIRSDCQLNVGSINRRPMRDRMLAIVFLWREKDCLLTFELRFSIKHNGTRPDVHCKGFSILNPHNKVVLYLNSSSRHAFMVGELPTRTRKREARGHVLSYSIMEYRLS